MREGNGMFQLVDKTKYEGEWLLDRFSGASNRISLQLKSSKFPEATSSITTSWYSGGTKDGVMHGNGVIHFEHGNISGNFEDGQLKGGATFTLRDGTKATVEHFKDDWSFTYSANATLVSSVGTFEWNGNSVQWKEKGIERSIGDLHRSISNLTSSSTVGEKTLVHLLEQLTCLKWIEFHLSFSKQFVESDVFPFEYVDTEDLSNELKEEPNCETSSCTE